MRPVLVCSRHASCHDAAHVAQAGETVLRQALISEATVEALEVSTAICAASLLQSSTTVGVFTRRPLAR